jgi:hypothetical protein
MTFMSTYLIQIQSNKVVLTSPKKSSYAIHYKRERVAVEFTKLFTVRN